MEFDTVYTGVCSSCCEIDVGTKNSSLISWQVMFFKREKSLLLAPIIRHAITWKKTLNYYSLYGQVCTCKACKKLAAKT